MLSHTRISVWARTSMLLVISVLLSMCAAPPDTQRELHVGRAWEDITPEHTGAIHGYYYQRSVQEIHDPLLAKALVLDDGEKQLVFVECDVISMHDAVTQQVRSVIQDRLSIPGDQIFLAATHTHTGGPVREFAYREFVTGRIISAIEQAFKSRTPQQAGYASIDNNRLSFNRRYRMKDGSIKTNPGKMNPDVVQSSGPIDPEVQILVFGQPEKSFHTILVNFALHTATLEMPVYSADYPYFLHRTLQWYYGSDILTVFAQGTAGNINHWNVFSPDPQEGYEEAERIGTTLAGSIIEALTQPVWMKNIRLAHSRETVRIDAYPVSNEDIHRAEKILEHPITKKITPPYLYMQPEPVLQMHWAKKIMQVKQQSVPYYDVDVQVFALGQEAAIVGLPGEIFAETGLAIKGESPFKQTLVVELANQWIGPYVPPRQQTEEGGYESFNSKVAPGSAEHLQESAIRQLHTVYTAVMQ